MNKTATLSIILSASLLLISIGGNAQHQNHLILKKGYKNQLHFLIGDEIRFTDVRSDVPIIGVIQEIGEDFITVNKTVYPIKEILTVVHRRQSFNYRAGGKTLQIAGPGLLAVGATNSLIQGTRPIWPTPTLIAAAVISLSGFLLPLLQDRVYRLGDQFVLRIVPSDPELNKQSTRQPKFPISQE